MKRIPFFPQENEYFCGPATIAMTLAVHGMRVSQKTIAKRARTTVKDGTSPKKLVETLKHFKLNVKAGNRKTIGDIRRALKKDSIVIVCYTEPILEWGHYAIVKEIRDKKITLIDSDARTGRTSLLLDEFNRRWREKTFKTRKFAAIVAAPKPKK